MTGQADNNRTKDVEIIVPLWYLRNFWVTLEISLINREINFILTWSANCFIVFGIVANQVPTFAKTGKKPYVRAVPQNGYKSWNQF